MGIGTAQQDQYNPGELGELQQVQPAQAPPDPVTTQLINAAILGKQQQAILNANYDTGLHPQPLPQGRPGGFDYYAVAQQPPYNPYYDYAAKLLAQGDMPKTPEGQQLQALIDQMIGVAQPVKPLQFGGAALVPKGRMLMQQSALTSLGVPAGMLQEQYLQQQERNLRRQLLGAQLGAQAGMHWLDTVLKGWLGTLDSQTKQWIAEYTSSIDQSNLDAQLKNQLKIALLEDAMRRYIADKTAEASQKTAEAGKPATWQSVLAFVPGLLGAAQDTGLLDWIGDWLGGSGGEASEAAANAASGWLADAAAGWLAS